MDRIGKANYEKMPWSSCDSAAFTKPKFEQIPFLKEVPLWNRDQKYSEFYELQTYIDLTSATIPGKMLDLGSGSGTLSYFFTCKGWNVVACDVEPLAFYYTNTPFIEANLNSGFPFKNDTFDIVICKQVIEHLENPKYLIHEIGRVLRSGGKVILSTPNIVSLQSRFMFLRTGFLPHFKDGWKEHQSILHCDQLQSMLQESHFQDIEFYTNRYLMYNLSSKINGKRMRFLVPFLKFISSHNNMPMSCRFGYLLILSAMIKK